MLSQNIDIAQVNTQR